MKATADTIWQVPAYLPYLQPPLTDEIIAAAEKKISYPLPGEYLDLLRKQNGGYIRFAHGEVLIHSCIAGIGPYYPSIIGRTSNVASDAQEEVSFPLKGLIPFDGDGHWFLCFDYRKNRKAPAVAYIDVECDQQRQIARSFADYLAMLQPAVADEYVIEADMNVEEAVAQLSSAISLPFEAPDSNAHGYPVHRASAGTKESPEWVWASPNLVRRGFVRASDRRYKDLKDLMPGTALRYPGVPANGLIIDTTPGVRVAVVAGCERRGISIRKLSDYYHGGV